MAQPYTPKELRGRQVGFRMTDSEVARFTRNAERLGYPGISKALIAIIEEFNQKAEREWRRHHPDDA